MRALVKFKTGRGNMEIRDVPVPVPSGDEVLIKVSACGVCGSDIHILNDEFANTPPVIIGHELSGIIEAIGSSVSGWFPGDRVVTELHTGSCGTCRLCRTGNRHVCRAKKPLGSKTDGGFAEYIKIPQTLLHKIPEKTNLVDAALTEPTAICIHALTELGKVKAGDCTVILGAGPIGLLSAVVARKLGAGCVIVAGTDRDVSVRLKAAKKLGADAVVNVQKDNLADFVEDISDGVGADVVIEASGAPSTINQAIEISRRKGIIIAIGMTKEDQISVAWNKAIIKETEIFLPFSSTWTSWELGLKFLSDGIVNPKILTNRRPLEEWREAFDDSMNCRTIKTLLIL